MKDKIKVHFVRKVYGLGGGTISGSIFEKLLANYVELCGLDESQVIHNYDGPLKKFKKPSVFVVNSWKFTCPACIQTTTYDGEICLKGSLFKCMNCYAHNKTFQTKTKREAMRGVSSLYYIKNKQRLSQLKKQENIVSISKSLRRVLEENGVRVTQAIYDPIDPIFLEKEKQTTNEKYFFHHGNYDWIHGVSLLIDSRKYTKHPLKMVGWGIYSDNVKKTDINSLGAIHDSIKVKELINNAYAYIYPCLHNNFGRSLIEAMALGKPIIAINRGFSKEIIENWKSGILINPDPKELADAMQYLWDNEEEAKKMGENARKIALNEFHPDVTFREYLKLYRSLV